MLRSPMRIPGIVGRLRPNVLFCRLSDSVVLPKRTYWEPRKNTDRVKSSNQLKYEMELLFFKTQVRQMDVDRFIAENLSAIDPQGLSDLMRVSVKASKSSRLPLLAKHLPKIAAELKLHNLKKWSFKEISFVIYGLQMMHHDDDGSLEIIEIMTKIATKSIKFLAPTEQEISMLLLGLQQMSHDKEEVRKLLLLVASMVNRCSDKFIAQTVGNSFYSLQAMESDCVEVRALLTALLPKVQQCKDELKSQHVGNAFYGLQGMHSDSSEVRAILLELAQKTRLCRQTFSAQEISNALYGLQGMGSDCSEVHAVLSALVPKIVGCQEVLEAQHMANILYGVQGMDSSCPEVCKVLSALVPKFQESGDIFDAQTVGNSLYGLQGMKADSREVRSILSALVTKVYNCHEPLGVREIGNGLYGLQGLGKQLESSLLSDYLYKQMEQMLKKTSNFRGLPTNKLFYLCQILTLTLVEIKSSLGDKYERWEGVNILANKELNIRRDADDPFFTPGKIRSTNEQRVHTVATTLFENSRILMSFNGYLFGLFETDLVLKVPIPKTDEFFYMNIEMTGVYHMRQKRERFCMLRDKYLKSRGVVIERIDVLTLRQMDEVELMKWLLSKVTEATKKLREPPL